MGDKPPMPWWVLPSIAYGVLIIFSGTLVGSFFVDDSTMRIALSQAAVQLVMLAVGYFFGSSAGSEKKSDAIAASNQKKDDTIAATVLPAATSTTKGPMP